MQNESSRRIEEKEGINDYIIGGVTPNSQINKKIDCPLFIPLIKFTSS
jgi:hypothetical protein